MKAEFLPKTDYVYASDEEDFIEEKDLSVCAVNAGDGALYLGGGGINRAFEFEMRNSGISNKDVAPLNQKAVDLIRSGDYGQGVFIPVPAAKPFKYVYTIGALLGEENAGLVVLFVWNGKNAPKQFQSNVGMLYVVGPRGGCQPTAEFESLLEKLSYNTVRIVQLFNEAHPDDKIGALRYCLVSGGAFRDPALTKLEVADLTLRGLEKISWGVETSPVIRFAYDEDVFRKAFSKRPSS